MVPNCKVDLDNTRGIYHPGQMVTGRIQMVLEERILIKGFAWKLSGYAETRWEKPVKEKKKEQQQQESKKPKVEKPKEYYIGRNDYVCITNYMFGSEDASSPTMLQAGVYQYQVSACLPPTCPSSSETAIGHIRYELEVFLVYPDRHHTCFSRNLQVARPLDLRLQSHDLLQPVNLDVCEPVKRAKFWQHPLQLHVNTPQRGYVPGERISVYVKLLNGGRVPLNDLTYRVNLVATSMGRHKNHKLRSRVDRTNLLTKVHSLFGQNGSMVEHLESLQLPSAPPTTPHADCECLQISYDVEVVIRSTNPKRSVHALVPITVGTISLQDKQTPMLVAPALLTAEAATTAAPATASAMSASMENLASAPPLDSGSLGASNLRASNLSVSMGSLSSSFKEADFMHATKLNKNSKQTLAGEMTDFKPKYLYYNLEADLQEAEVSSTTPKEG